MQEKLILRLTFNPGLELTGFRTTLSLVETHEKCKLSFPERMFETSTRLFRFGVSNFGEKPKTTAGRQLSPWSSVSTIFQ